MLHKIITKCNVSSLTYNYYDNCTLIPEKDWNTVNDDQCIFFSLNYLKIAEQTLSENIEFKYILFYHKTTPVAFAITQLFNFNSDQLQFQEFPCKVGDSVKNKFISNLDVSVLTCGNLFACGEYGFKYNKELITAKTAFESLSNALRKLRQNENKPSFILLKEFWPRSFSESDQMKLYDFREFKVDVNMVLELQNWETFDDYLASMRTKFRTRVKTVFKKSEDLLIRDFSSKDIEQYKEDISNLYSSVLENADFKIGEQNIATFKSLKETLNTKFIFKAYFLKEKLVAFSTAFLLNNVIEANHIGIDYTYNKSHAIYQRILYDYVHMAIHKKVKELRLGRTAETIKSTVGAKPVDMKLYIRHRNSISNTLLKPLVELISPSDYEVRNPFKAKQI
ncbi:peptidogalycan biosysnthesis protein [Aquimarina agarilytica]|uniref:peptidogalycan biosysnthesis protein n=1 Tax=Aquimarina agarilytica TaxID=1087449 RepID=UPI000288BED7|nr:peptidogalycan biosysnthesis protein [Aquimarina agarilytica]